MQTQSSGYGPHEPTPMLPTMPQARNDIEDLPPPVPPSQKQPPTEAETALAERAEATRRRSLRRQRAAQKR